MIDDLLFRRPRHQLAPSLARLLSHALADPPEGKDSALYETMGYTRASERKSGLHRAKGGGTGGGGAPKT